MNILAIDLGTKSGYAHTLGQSGIWNLKPLSCQSAGQLYVNLLLKLDDLVTITPTDVVVYEEVKAHRAVDAAHVFGGLEATLQAFCINNNIQYRGVAVSTIQKHATGRGMAPKGQKKKLMKDAAILKFKGTNVIDDNHADALWLLDYATKKLF